MSHAPASGVSSNRIAATLPTPRLPTGRRSAAGAATLPTNEAVRMPILRRTARAPRRRPRDVAAVRELRREPRTSTRWNRSTLSMSGCVADASLSSSMSTSLPRRSSPSTPTSPRSRRRGCDHAKDYVAMITDRLGLDTDSFVVELASNDGYLLQYFVERGIPCLGIEPAANVAAAAVEKGVPTDVSFFGVDHAGKMAADGQPRRPRAWQQRARPGSGPQRFRRWHSAHPRTRRHGDDRVPPPPRHARGEPVRHDLPRALLLLLAASAPRRSSQVTA